MKVGRKPFVIPHNKTVNWSLPNHLIAKQLGISVMTTWQLRKRMGFAPLPKGRPTDLVYWLFRQNEWK